MKLNFLRPVVDACSELLYLERLARGVGDGMICLDCYTLFDYGYECPAPKCGSKRIGRAKNYKGLAKRSKNDLRTDAPRDRSKYAYPGM